MGFGGLKPSRDPHSYIIRSGGILKCGGRCRQLLNAIILVVKVPNLRIEEAHRNATDYRQSGPIQGETITYNDHRPKKRHVRRVFTLATQVA